MNEVVFPANAYCAPCDPYLRSDGIPADSYALLFEADGDKGNYGMFNGHPGQASYMLSNSLSLNNGLNVSDGKAYFDAFIDALNSKTWHGDQSYGGGSSATPMSPDMFEPCENKHEGVKLGDEGVYQGWYNNEVNAVGWREALIWWADDRIHVATAVWDKASS